MGTNGNGNGNGKRATLLLGNDEPEILPPFDPFVSHEASILAEWASRPENQLATLGAIMQSSRDPKARIAATKLANEITIQQQKAQFDNFIIRFKNEVDMLVSQGMTPEQAIDVLKESMECLPPNAQQKILLQLRTSLWREQERGSDSRRSS